MLLLLLLLLLLLFQLLSMRQTSPSRHCVVAAVNGILYLRDLTLRDFVLLLMLIVFVDNMKLYFWGLPLMTSCFYCCYCCDILPLGHYLLRGLVVVVTLLFLLVEVKIMMMMLLLLLLIWHYISKTSHLIVKTCCWWCCC